MTPPTWVYLASPVPQVVADRAKVLLHQLTLGEARIESTNVECMTTLSGVASHVLRYTCENHGHGVTGISVYGLV